MRNNARKDITLIVPAAGRSSRYPGLEPKWMLKHPNGKSMIENVLDAFKYKEYKRTYIVVVDQQCKDCRADDFISKTFEKNVDLIVLDKQTESCPETINLAIQKAGIQGRILVKDTDSLVCTEDVHYENFIVGLEINEHSNVPSIQNKSFICKNDAGIILDIIEKKIVSNTICIGAYCLDSSDFLSAYNQIKKSGLLITEKEIYMSHVVSFLILNEKVTFHFSEASVYKDWGTHKEWLEEAKEYKQPPGE